MVINLIGAPCTSKTLTAKRLEKELGIKHFEIDAYREQGYNNQDAWYHLMKDVAMYSKMCVVESSGISRWLDYMLNQQHIKRRGVLTIYLLGEQDVLFKRIDERERTSAREIPFEYKNLTIKGLVSAVRDKVPTIYDSYITIDTTEASIEEVYEEVKIAIRSS